jgi:hypothetical protein
VASFNPVQSLLELAPVVVYSSKLQDLAAGVFTCLYAVQLLETVEAFGRLESGVQPHVSHYILGSDCHFFFCHLNSYYAQKSLFYTTILTSTVP